MGKKGIHIPTELIAKYLAGECSAEELVAIESWKVENPDLFLQLETTWKDTGTLRTESPQLAFDVEEAWSRVKEGLENSGKKSFEWLPVMKIAATLLIGFGLGYWIAFAPGKIAPESSFQLSANLGTLHLEDGSVVTLNQNSALIYEEGFSPENRLVSLKGEAFFDIKSDPEHPFVISAGETRISVMGTSFNMKTETSGRVNVEVYSGLVRFETQNQSVELRTDEAAYFDTVSNKIEKIEVDRSGLTTFWKTQKLVFDDQFLPEIATILESAYGIQISLESPTLTHCQLHVSFEGSTIDEVMEIIGLTLELDISREGNQFKISGKGCGN